jgi:hypothetical protein
MDYSMSLIYNFQCWTFPLRAGSYCIHSEYCKTNESYEGCGESLSKWQKMSKCTFLGLCLWTENYPFSQALCSMEYRMPDKVQLNNSEIFGKNKVCYWYPYLRYLLCDSSCKFDDNIKEGIQAILDVCGPSNGTFGNKMIKYTKLKFYKTVASPSVRW